MKEKSHLQTNLWVRIDNETKTALRRRMIHGHYATISDVIRQAIREYLQDEPEFSGVRKRAALREPVA